MPILAVKRLEPVRLGIFDHNSHCAPISKRLAVCTVGSTYDGSAGQVVLLTNEGFLLPGTIPDI